MTRYKNWLAAAICFALGLGIGAAYQLPKTTAAPNSSATPVDVAPRNSDASAEPTALAVAESSNAQPADDKLRIICFGAHPDDCEIKAGGVAAMWAARGHHVKFVAVTNGDIGHWREAGGPLAQRRYAEVQKAAQILGITTDVLDIHDGELEPTLENRRAITRLIRGWNADLVMGPRTNDYHPDHRYTGVLVQDAAFMVAVPYFCPDAPALKANPVFMYFPDRFQKPNPFEADIAVSIDAVARQKVDALVGMESQFVEGGALGSAELIEGGEPKLDERRKIVRENFAKRDRDTAESNRKTLAEWYGEESAKKIAFAEAFEVCEYGKQPTQEELRKLFPFFAEK